MLRSLKPSEALLALQAQYFGPSLREGSRD